MHVRVYAHAQQGAHREGGGWALPSKSKRMPGMRGNFFSSTPGHNYTGHNYTGHNYIGHNYIGHNYLGRNYLGRNYLGRDYD